MARWLMAILIGLGATNVVAADGPAEEIPQLKVLSQYVGTWEATVSSPNSPLTQATHTAEWILDGHFLQQDVTLKTDDGQTAIRSRNLYTYDKTLGKYRTWSFLSDGNVRSATGTWDESTRTLTFVNRENGMVSRTTAHFVEEGVEHWNWTIKRSSGETLFEMSGESRRQSK